MKGRVVKLGLSLLALLGSATIPSMAVADTTMANAPTTPCEAGLMTVGAVDAQSGKPISGVNFEVSNASNVAMGVVPVMDSNSVDLKSLMGQHVTWQKTFDTELDNAFLTTSVGKKWIAASPSYASSVKKATSFTKLDKTPVDITNIVDSARQLAALSTWAALPDGAANSSILTFSNQNNQNLDLLGDLTFTNFDTNKPAASSVLKVNPALSKSASQILVKAYDHAMVLRSAALDASMAAGYPNATYKGTVLDLGKFDAKSLNWAKFVKAQKQLVSGGSDAEAAALAGATTPDYETVLSAVGDTAVTQATKKANDSIKAVTLAPKDSVNLPTTNTFGQSEYVVFTSGANPSDTCANMVTSVKLKDAPKGYSAAGDTNRIAPYDNSLAVGLGGVIFPLSKKANTSANPSFNAIH